MAQIQKILFFILITLFLFNYGRAEAQDKNTKTFFFVSPNGDDQNPGTKEMPLATLTGARDMVRKFKKEHAVTAPIVISIKGGVYEMTEPLTLLPEDGGTSQYPITYKAEEGSTPVFSGGKRITGFTVNQNGIWEVKIPEIGYYNGRFDQLYVNGKRAILARTPNEGFLKIADVDENIWEKGKGRVAERAQQVLFFDSANFSSLQKITEQEIGNVRFRAYHKWDFTMRFLDKIDADSARVYTYGRGMKPWNPLQKEGRIVFENYAAALDAPGEWYLNHRRILFYMPLAGETPENTEVVIPVLENIISVEGDTAANNLVENIGFEGLTFTHSHYRIPRPGSEPTQAAVHINAAIMLEGAKNITFSNCEISRTGQHALWFGKGCSDSVVAHCYLNELGGGGIYLGDIDPLEGIGHTQNIRIHNNIIQTGGQEFPSAVGVWVGHSSDIEVSHNDIGNFYYTGVSVGWIWGYADSNAKRNKIINNRIHHIGWTLLSDMAAVYTLGKSEGTVVGNNVIHHVHAYSYGGWGLYTDEGSSDILMENNLVYSTKTGGFHQHFGKSNIIRNNIFAYAKSYQVQCTRVEEHRSFNFQNNIVVFNEGVVLQGPWDKIDIYMDKNLYWNTAGDTYLFAGKSFADWQKTGHDRHSIIANPHFKDAQAYDFGLKNKRNVKRIGFVPFDYLSAGVYGESSWIEKAKLPASIAQAFDHLVEQNMAQKTGRD